MAPAPPRAALLALTATSASCSVGQRGAGVGRDAAAAQLVGSCSWGVHALGATRPLTLQHLQHHVDDVLVPGVPALQAARGGMHHEGASHLPSPELALSCSPSPKHLPAPSSPSQPFFVPRSVPVQVLPPQLVLCQPYNLFALFCNSKIKLVLEKFCSGKQRIRAKVHVGPKFAAFAMYREKKRAELLFSGKVGS